MKTIIVDDERWMLVHFEDECAVIPEIELLAKFSNPLMALDYAKKERFEVAFIDIEMPQMNGFVLAERLREINADLKIVIVSAYEKYKDDIGIADYYLLKPYSAKELLIAIHQISCK